MGREPPGRCAVLSSTVLAVGAVPAAALAEGAPVLWYANRASGFVLLALLTLSTAAGVLAGSVPGTTSWPRAATQSLHRNLGLLSMVLLVVHATTSVVDEFVDIRWWQAFVPFTSAYQRVWLGLGVVALDLLIAVVITSMVRGRMGHGVWRGVHLTAYAAWVLGAVHGLLMGTDSGSRWGLVMSTVCAMVVACAVGARLVSARSAPPSAAAPTADPVRVGRRMSP